MGHSPALSPRPNLPGPGHKGLPPKAKALAVLNGSNASPTTTAASSPGGPGLDIGAKMNEEVQHAYIISRENIGQGTYADVFLGHKRSDPSTKVAIKKIRKNKDWKDGISIDAIREIRFLFELDHPHILKLYDVFTTKDQNISLVLEHLPNGDLQDLWYKYHVPYTGADIKSWMNMLCQAVWFCHEHRILHRDIKGNNVLIAANGAIKLADFGLARPFAEPGRNMTSQVITTAYRPPELFYGARHYGGKVDIWSVGCVMAELALRSFFMPGDSDIHQLSLINDVFGTPTEESWPGISKLDNYVMVGEKRPQPMSYWRGRFGMLGEDGIDLLRSMMQMDPRKRLSAKQVLEHRYWTNAPKPTPKEELPKKGGGEKKMAETLKRQQEELGSGRADKVARKLDFGAMRK